MGCAGSERIMATREEAYIANEQADLGIHLISCSNAIQTVKKYSKDGVLTVATFARVLQELGLIRPKDDKIDLEKLVQDKKWERFYGCLSNYQDKSGETFNALNIIMTFILLANCPDEEKISLLYENLDWQCRGYITRTIVRLFIKNFCVVSAEIIPYYAESLYINAVDIRGLRGMLTWAVERAPDSLTKKVMGDWPRLKREEFVGTFSGGKFKHLFNAVLLRRWLAKTYQDEFELQKRKSPQKPRLSVYHSESSPF